MLEEKTMRLRADQEGPLNQIGEPEIIAAVRGVNAEISPSAAIHELVRRDARRALTSLGEVIRDPDAPTEAKSAAIRELGHHGEADAQRALLDALQSDRRGEVRSAAESLARVGNKEALEVLTSLRLNEDDPARRSVDAATRLIAFRAGVDGYRLERPARRQIMRVDAAHSVELAVKPVRTGEIEAVMTEIRREVPKIELSSTRAMELDCLGDRLWLMHQEGLEGEGRLAPLAQTPAVPMVIMAYSGCTERPYLYAYVLSQPEDGGCELYVARLRGQVTHYGQGRISDDSLSFELQSINTRFARPAELTGVFNGVTGELSLRAAQVNRGVPQGQEQRRRPTVIPEPS
jgi:hypothetical protein